MLGLNRIDNMDILCKDFLAVVDFYHSNLELPFFLPYAPEKGWAAIDAGNLTIYIFKTDVGTHAPRRTPINEENAPGLDSIAWEVDDLDATIEALDGRVEWASDRIIDWHHQSGTWYRYRPFYDPEGNMLYVTEPHKVGTSNG